MIKQRGILLYTWRMLMHGTVREVASVNLYGNEWGIKKGNSRSVLWALGTCAQQEVTRQWSWWISLSSRESSQCSFCWLIWVTGRGQSGGARLDALSGLGEVLSLPWLPNLPGPCCFEERPSIRVGDCVVKNNGCSSDVLTLINNAVAMNVEYVA